MAQFKCSCGENLVVPEGKGVVRCWFCEAQFAFPQAAPVLVYEAQESRPIIRTLDVHTMGHIRKKKSDPCDI